MVIFTLKNKAMESLKAKAMKRLLLDYLGRGDDLTHPRKYARRPKESNNSQTRGNNVEQQRPLVQARGRRKCGNKEKASAAQGKLCLPNGRRIQERRLITTSRRV